MDHLQKFAAALYTEPDKTMKMVAFWDIAPCSLVEVHHISDVSHCPGNGGIEQL
jgi:hypothetical protein